MYENFWLPLQHVMDLSNILFWNVRGLNRKAHRDSIRALIVSLNPELICLQETKIQHMTTATLWSTLGTQLDQHTCLPAEGTRGGILIAWKSTALQSITTRIDGFSVSILFRNPDGVQWWFTGVYGPQPDAQKVLFLEELRNLHAARTGPWLVGGDFNLIYRAADKNNNNVNRAMMGRFRRFLNEVELKEIELLGRRFTWSNERSAPTLVRLDHAFCTQEWETIYLDYILQSSADGISDHCPLILSLRCNNNGKRRFHFESFWPKMQGLQEAVQAAWSSAGEVGGPLERLAAKLQSWNDKSVGNVNDRLQLARELLHCLEIARDNRELDVAEEWLRR